MVKLTFGEKGVDVLCLNLERGHVEYAVHVIQSVINYDNLCHYKSDIWPRVKTP